jgi:hypothetical protein
MAIEEWVKLKAGKSVPLERALAAYDMLVLHDREGDFDDVSGDPLEGWLENKWLIASGFYASRPSGPRNPRRRARPRCSISSQQGDSDCYIYEVT